MIQPRLSGLFDLNLESSDLHIWHASLDPVPEQLEYLQSVLSVDEQKRSQKFRFWRHKRRFMAGRGILRVLLGRYLKMDPEEIYLQYNEYGKPYLPVGNPQFNLANCRDLALYVFCLNADIGVDLECIRSIEDVSGIASRFFSPSENAVLKSAPTDQQLELFFTYWTLKEAYIKAVGQGLSYPLDSFEISITEKDGDRVFQIGRNNELLPNWSLFSLKSETGCAEAVAVQGGNWKINNRRFTL